MTASQRPVASMPHPHAASDLCPWCDQPVPHNKFAEIQAKIAAKERERLASLEQSLKEKLTAERATVEAKAAADVKLAQTAAAAVAEKARLDVEASARASAAAIKQAKDEVAAKEQAAREAGWKAGEVAAGEKVAGLLAEKAKIEAEVLSLKAAQDAELRRQLAEQRAILDKAAAAALDAERAKAFEEKLQVQKSVEELKRQLEAKKAKDADEAADINVLDELKAAFPEDDIRPVKKGAAGSDIVQIVKENGQACGTIIYACKNRMAWRNDDVGKLLDDQRAAKAEYALLAARVLPAGHRQIHVQDGVIIAHPARVAALAEVVRRQIIQNHTLRLSNEERADKTIKLYDFVRSEQFSQKLSRIETLANQLLELDVHEAAWHKAQLEKRGKIVRSVLRESGELTNDVGRIIGTAKPPSEGQ